MTRFLALPGDRQRSELLEVYLLVEDHLIRSGEGLSRDRLRARLRDRLGRPPAEPSPLEILFESPERQELFVCRRLLGTCLERAIALLGATGNNALGESLDWLHAVPDRATLPIPFGLADELPDRHEDWLHLLARLSLDLFERLEKKLGSKVATNLFDRSFDEIEASLMLLEAFPAVVEVLPDPLLDERKIELLTRHQIHRIFLRKAHAHQRNEARLQAFLNALDDLAFELDRDGNVLDVWTREPGRLPASRDEILGRNLSAFLDPEQGERLLAAVRRVATSGSSRSLSFSLPSGSADERSFSAVLSPIRGIPYTPPTVACLVRDMTSERRAAAEREALIRQLKEANAELDLFASAVSHDLKSPLFTIAGFLEPIEDAVRRGDPEGLSADLARVRAAADHMGELIDGLLELSRIGRDARPHEELSLADVARETVDLMSATLAGAAVKIDVPAETAGVRGDRVRLRQVLQNLVENAVKFMGAQSCPAIEIGTREDSGERVFFVRDNGIGIEPQHREKVFGPFDQLDKKRRGTGLGLALVRRIVEHHGGCAWVESAGTGTGSCFCFTLPGTSR